MTVLPVGGTPPNPHELRRLANRSLRGRRLRLVIDDDEPVDLPPILGEALAEVISILDRGRPVSITPQQVELTTGQAADLLGVTRPTVVKLMEDGILPFTRPNSSRRITLHDVLAYKQQRSNIRRRTLVELTADGAWTNPVVAGGGGLT
jgi:excisionase family DNA binding protein